MLPWDDCKLKVDSTTPPITVSTGSGPPKTTTLGSTTNPTTQSTNAPKYETATFPTKPTPQTEETTKPPEPDLCFHDGKYYEEGRDDEEAFYM
jgi:hypothetical protein